MATVHFIGKEQDGNGNDVYHLTINGVVYLYNRRTDSFKNANEDYETFREDMPGDVLRAFHEAWDPAAYAAAMKTPPLTEDGIPDETEDPTSPIYYPAEPQGDPAELRRGHVTTVDLAGLINKAMNHGAAR